MNNKFDTQVQMLKYKVLKEVAKKVWNNDYEHVLDIPNIIIPGNKPTMRCCVYKERAILGERVKLAFGGDKSNPNVIEVISIACDDCPAGGYEVTNACRGCLAHRCQNACHRNAIYFDNNQHAHIDKTKCIECGMCSKVCPYSSIINYKRPCQSACKVNAISISEDLSAQINNSKCIACGSCVYQCPFGAISDKSYIVDVIKLIQNSHNNTSYKVYAIVAPSIFSQFDYATHGQVVTGIKNLGFYDVFEVAVGADMTIDAEAKEFEEKQKMTSSCCPAFVKYIENNFPSLKDMVSTTLSPMAMLGKFIKEKDKDAKVIFIGPCTAKKSEIKKYNVKDFVDSVLTFEELQALIDSKDIILNDLPETELNNASCFGRIFARSGGVSEALKQSLIENNISNTELKPVVCDGIEQCRVALTKAEHNVLDGNFIEGMACLGGCIGGAGCLKHEIKDKASIDTYGNEATNKTIHSALKSFKDK